ncbi:MAG: TetR family transcriptional regulator [Dehalococcoidia bacterium]|nr:TetR family transcriptional regulator [Dehalococcoidia bacterium]
MRDRILEAARDLFYEKGLDATSMRDIAAAVGLVPSSLYNHFPTKDSLVKAVMERNFEAVDPQIEPLFEAEPSVELLWTVLQAHAFQHIRSLKETMLFHLQGAHMPQQVRERVLELRHVYEERFYRLAEELAELGLVTRHEPRTRMRFLLSAGAGINSWFQPGGRLNAEAVARVYADMGLAALDARRD